VHRSAGRHRRHHPNFRMVGPMGFDESDKMTLLWTKGGGGIYARN